MDGKNDPYLAALALVLREKRKSMGLSQEELAHRAGLSMRYVSLLESCRHQPTLATLRGLSAGLGLPLSALLAEVEARL
ncbi:helix-turn-helix domain-containing protein [Pseudogemmobacter humi]|uniref:Anaerobic benzoate catabolism transcriptional regulator n=1 Tax=Pseudogemmobacter humi TaxID=2483812 RepID=A0A3P5XR87_9RHOB|nr:helix-turn-helix transcriptional regulator [Pseudogemmobacter humi]VDC31363.1 anaerobic benzoate catabolism transcriptional regulator [Pseudogemmobacter humi]